MSIPDPVYLNNGRPPDDLTPLTKYVVVLTHGDGTVEVVVADARNKQQPYTISDYAYSAALKFQQSGCYKSVVVAPCRTLAQNATPKAYETAAEANCVLETPELWERNRGQWRKTKINNSI